MAFHDDAHHDAIRRGHAAAREAGKKHGRTPAPGEIGEYVISQRDSGAGWETIAQRLNTAMACGGPRPPQNGSRWYRSSVRHIYQRANGAHTVTGPGSGYGPVPPVVHSYDPGKTAELRSKTRFFEQQIRETPDSGCG